MDFCAIMFRYMSLPREARYHGTISREEIVVSMTFEPSDVAQHFCLYRRARYSVAVFMEYTINVLRTYLHSACSFVCF